MAAAAAVVPLLNQRKFQLRRELKEMTDRDIVERFRLSRERITWLAEEFSGDLERETNRNSPLTAETQILIALRYFATGGFLKVIGDAMGVSKASTSRCINQVTKCLGKLAKEWIHFPSTAREISDTMTSFYELKGFPKVIGAIDGSLIPIKAPTLNEHLYVCHKGFHAINIMAVCDATLKITNLVAKWQGSIHDCAVFNMSTLQIIMEERKDAWLLGDRGYGISPYLLTPFNPNDHLTKAQASYQSAQIKTRNVIERCFGVLKQRFRCIDHSGGLMQFVPPKCCDIVVAVVVFHNMCIIDKTELIDEVPYTPDDFGVAAAAINFVQQYHNKTQREKGMALRDKLISDVFSY